MCIRDRMKSGPTCISLKNWRGVLTAPDQSPTSSLDKDRVVFRPTGFADLAGKRVGIFGYGVEGHATQRRLADVAGSLVLVDDAPGLGDDVLVTTEGGLDALRSCDVVLKSPGIPRRRR